MHQEGGPGDDLLSGYLRQLSLDEEEEKEEEEVNVPEGQLPTWRLLGRQTKSWTFLD